MIDPLFLNEQIRLNKVALRKALRTISKFQNKPPTSEEYFCEYPLSNGMIGNLPTQLWGPAGSDTPKMISFDPALGLPIEVSGTCS